MATFRKRGDKQWEVRIRRKGYPPKNATFPTKYQAERWAQDIEYQMGSKTYRDTSLAETTTVSELLDRFVREVIGRRENYSSDPGRIKNICRHLGDLPLIAVTPESVAQYRNNRLRLPIPPNADDLTKERIAKRNQLERRVGPSSVRREMNILSSAIKQGMSEWSLYLPHGNPVTPVKRPKKEPNRERRPTESEFERLVENTDSPYLHDICCLAVETAMRRGEIARIRWEDINLTKRQLHIPITKNGTPRHIPLSSEAVEILLKQSSDKVKPPESGYVFPIRADSITQAFNRARDKAGIDDLRFHDLRHEATSRFFEMDFDHMKVAQITGHKDLRCLMDYTHLRPSNLASEIDAAKARFKKH